MSTTTIDRLRNAGLSYRATLIGDTVSVFLLIALLDLAFPSSIWGNFLAILTNRSTLSSALRLSVPITFAALGDISSRKADVVSIGFEGLPIISAFTAVITTTTVSPEMTAVGLPTIWISFLAGIPSPVLFSALFAVVCIRFKADQIIAGLAVWLVTLGLAPFAATVYYGGVNTDNLGTALGTWTIPVLSDIPFFDTFSDADPTVYMILVAVPASWYVLNHTAFGHHVRASSESPKALDTVGVDVNRAHYADVLLSGFLAVIGGFALSFSLDRLVGNNRTMVNGEGFIAIVAFLFGDYNPVGALGASFLFAGLEAAQIHPQQVPGYGVPDSFIQTAPYVTMLVILALVDHTCIPAASGEHYDADGDSR